MLFNLNELYADVRHNMPPPRLATKVRSCSLEPGRPSWARAANTRHPASRPHTARRPYERDRRHTDRRQTNHRLMPPRQGHNKACLSKFGKINFSQGFSFIKLLKYSENCKYISYQCFAPCGLRGWICTVSWPDVVQGD